MATVPVFRAGPPTLRLLHLPCRAHFAFVYLNVFWTSWLIVEYYKVCCSIRPMLPSSRAQHHVLNNNNTRGLHPK